MPVCFSTSGHRWKNLYQETTELVKGTTENQSVFHYKHYLVISENAPVTLLCLYPRQWTLHCYRTIPWHQSFYCPCVCWTFHPSQHPFSSLCFSSVLIFVDTISILLPMFHHEYPELFRLAYQWCTDWFVKSCAKDLVGIIITTKTILSWTTCIQLLTSTWLRKIKYMTAKKPVDIKYNLLFLCYYRCLISYSFLQEQRILVFSNVDLVSKSLH